MNSRNDADTTKHLSSSECTRQWDMKTGNKAWFPPQLPAGSDIGNSWEGSKTHNDRLWAEDVAKQKSRKLLV